MAAPKLRFKEFDKAFSRNTIKELAKIYVGRDLVEDAYSPIKTETHIYPIYSNSVDNEGLYGYYNFEEFNFDDDALTVVGRGAGLGKAFYRQGGFGTIGRLLSLTPKDKSFHPKYLSDYINDKLIIHNESGGIPQLPRSSLENYEVVLPSYEEQTKIASFLSNVDEKISQLTQKHALLSQYKQGMMQKLFSQQIRFKADDGSEFGEWEEKTIQYFLDQNYIFDQMDGNHGELYPKSEEFSDSGIPYIGATDFSNGTVNFLSCKKIPLERAIKFKKGIAKNGDVLFAHNATVGPVALLMTNLEFVILSTTATYYRCNPKKLINTYLKSVLESDYFKKQYVGIMSQSTRNQVPITTQRKLNLVVPCLEEQTKIANFLSAIDQKIEVVAQQIEQAKIWKKGLLLQMFV